MTGIWEKVNGKQFIKPVMATIHRIVEDQEEIATFSLVNNLEEQAILEELLETSKPKVPLGYEDLHYLLTTPFRYPPLKYGSRFGTSFEPSLFYGSLNVSTALAETAYYRFVYISGMEEAYCEPITLTYSSFTVAIRTDRGVLLDKEPFNHFNQVIASPNDYRETQKLGSSMRNADVEAFQYVSARDPQKGKNVALFKPSALKSKKPIHMERWICNVTNNEVGFLSHDRQTERLCFKKGTFLVDGVMPAPSC